MPTNRQLEAFIATIEAQSMRAAADRLGISQPSVSKHIRSLERELGMELFARRRGTRILLSTDGQAIESEVRDLYSRSQRLVRSAAEGDEPRQITLYLWYFIYNWIEDRLLELEDLAESTKVLFEPVASSVPIVEMIAREENSAAFVRLTTIASHSEIDTHLLSIDPCSLYASTQWLASLDDETQALKEAKILLPGSGDLHWWMHNQLVHAGVHERQIEPVSWHPAAVRKKILAGEGVTVMLDENAKPHVDAGKLKPLDLRLGPMFLQLLTNRRMPNPLARELVARIKSLLP